MKMLRNIVILLLTIIGAVSLFMSSSIIFDTFGIREKEGNYVLLVVYSNLLCGILYLIAAFKIWQQKTTSIYLLTLALIILIIAFIGLIIHINAGGLYETKTIKAMTFRILFTLIMLFLARKIILTKKD
ncbi:MAG TPA: hypothetical protein VLZ83_15975 [Edaphocola sp.]|nr:hypothetical protein [Edaphocola sp.]